MTEIATGPERPQAAAGAGRAAGDGPTDRELMARIARRDEAAFAELVRRYGGRLYAAARRILASPEDAEDAVQRVFLQCHRSASTYRPEWAVSTWLYRITTNQCVDELRRRAARAAIDGALAAAAADGLPGARRAAAPVAGRLDFERALRQVPREARILLTLCYADGLSYRELARVRGISVNTVKSQIARGKSILRRALRGEAARPEGPTGPAGGSGAGKKTASRKDVTR
jgi:RNA polymerase sigma-70 factor (ECF subfamily)